MKYPFLFVCSMLGVAMAAGCSSDDGTDTNKEPTNEGDKPNDGTGTDKPGGGTDTETPGDGTDTENPGDKGDNGECLSERKPTQDPSGTVTLTLGGGNVQVPSGAVPCRLTNEPPKTGGNGTPLPRLLVYCQNVVGDVTVNFDVTLYDAAAGKTYPIGPAGVYASGKYNGLAALRYEEGPRCGSSQGKKRHWSTEVLAGNPDPAGTLEITEFADNKIKFTITGASFGLDSLNEQGTGTLEVSATGEGTLVDQIYP